jgi:hypothetical protein
MLSLHVLVDRFKDTHVVINAVWSTIQPLACSLLPRRNLLITLELITLRTNSPITSHIDVDCQVVTRAGRWVVHILLLL